MGTLPVHHDPDVSLPRYLPSGHHHPDTRGPVTVSSKTCTESASESVSGFRMGKDTFLSGTRSVGACYATFCPETSLKYENKRAQRI